MLRIVETGALLGVALDAAKSISAPDRNGGQSKALISIVFSAVAVEAFFNEVTELAGDCSLLEPQVVLVFAQVMSDAEKSHASLEAKLTLAHWIIAGKRLDRSAQLSQDLALLIYLRNRWVHFKADDRFEEGATSEDIHKDLISRFKHKNILAENVGQGHRPWTFFIETKAVAEWSCNVAAKTVRDFCLKVPKSSLRSILSHFDEAFAPENLWRSARRKRKNSPAVHLPLRLSCSA